MDLRYKRGHIYDGTGKITGSDSGGLECGYKGDHIGDYLSGRSGLDVYQIIMGIEEAFHIEIQAEKAERITTVGEAVELIKNSRE